MRTVIVDTLASIFFFTTVAALTELYLAGMEPREVLVTRLVMVPLMIVTGRPYGLYRDWVFVKSNASIGWSRTLMDIFAFLTFQLPVYAITLLVAGASLVQIMTLLPTTAFLMILLSRPFGLYLEMVRGWFGVRGV
ncbi:MAG: L-alanine exporter AlaE [Boseongicola sp.]|nr:L-alanine exporter AlaE [Boseongicola sp.]